MLANLKDRIPSHSLVGNTDLVIIRYDDKVSVLYGRCAHRGALMSDGFIRGDNIICGLHDWDYRFDTGVSSYNNKEKLYKFKSWIVDGDVFIDENEVVQWEQDNPQPYNREEYQGTYQDQHGTVDEPFTSYIRELAAHGLKGAHGPSAAMGIPGPELPKWADIQFVTAQLAQQPQLDDVVVGTDLVVGPNAKRPLNLDIPIFISDMSYGALSEEAKIALSKGAEIAGTGICSGEGGMLPEEKVENNRYFYELASGKFGFSMDLMKNVQAFHFKGGQGAKTGTGGHLPGNKVQGKIAIVRNLPEGKSAISPAKFVDWDLNSFKDFSEEIRKTSGGIPIGFKLSAQHIEADIDAALSCGVDYLILDGRGGGTGSAPTIFRDNISVPTIPALARARRHLDRLGRGDISLLITGGLRTPADFAKAMALGADGIGISNSALQAIGCLAMRACQTNNCPVGIATQKMDLRSRLLIDDAARRLNNFLSASIDLMKVLARACGHTHLNQFNQRDLTTWKKDMAHLTGIAYGGVNLCESDRFR